MANWYWCFSHQPTEGSLGITDHDSQMEFDPGEAGTSSIEVGVCADAGGWDKLKLLNGLDRWKTTSTPQTIYWVDEGTFELVYKSVLPKQ